MPGPAITNSKSTEDAQANLRSEIAAIRKDLQSLRHDVGGASHALLDTARSGASDVAQTAAEAARAARDRGVAATRSVENKISEQPLASVGIALGVGVLLGALMRRK
ncbi:MAG: hypothetical protein VYC34_02310 [Planctomycetota bacterium]|nr:hypothetical protein [Planctomycetota bacterium]